MIGGLSIESGGRRALASIQIALSRGEPVTPAGFGRFSVLTWASRKGCHPATGQELMIPPRKTLKFRAGKGVREAVQPQPQG
jgi:nucleoid DNA-binding protein